jgi:glycosyltransferase involved in cell wall biosynthesis
MIILVSHDKSLSGAPIALNNLERYLNKKGIKTVKLFLPNILNKKNRGNLTQGPTKEGPTNGGPTKGGLELELKKYSTLYKSENLIVIANTLVCYPVVKECLRLGIITYWWIHEWLDPTYNHNWKSVFNDPNIFRAAGLTLIMPCKKLLSNYQKYFGDRINQHKVIIMYNGYDFGVIEKYERIHWSRLVSGAGGVGAGVGMGAEAGVGIGIVGTIDARKQQVAFAMNVFNKLIKHKFNVYLILVGRDNIKNGFRNALTSAGGGHLQDRIIMPGEVPSAIPYIKGLDILVSYSRNEVLPLCIMEGMACALPIVSSNVGGVSELISDTGFLFKVNDARSCYEYLIRLISSKQLREALGRKAQQRFIKKFVEDKTFKTLGDIFQS